MARTRRLYILYTKSSLSLSPLPPFLPPSSLFPTPPTAMFHRIPPWERRVNKHLSFLAREATGRLKCLNLGAQAHLPLHSFASFSSPLLLHADIRTAGCPEGDARLRIMKIRMLYPGDGWIRGGTECNRSVRLEGISSSA